ncbi:DUF2254 domain-containing protein [Maritalea mobilis]|uniref:DUF2254 domain-containing protein n=1 Tax=Maritalea mobilis TaxID=483324 RepID=UPI001C958E6F|nr:DUF2254 domain-containing protein [Maritalea mobilis]MBY6200182.1 DUF2254 domain-containing protein [Maritalea mobilis]
MAYRALILKTLSDMRASYWFVPSCLVLGAAALAGGMLWLDTHAAILDTLMPSNMTDTQIDGARTVLSVIAQSVIGVAGVMFSITMVAVSFASGNFGPRLIGNFMRDRGNQWALGILIATFVYTLIILRSLQASVDGGVDGFVPQLSLMLAMGLAMLSVFVVIFYVHHVPETINVSNIAAGLGRRFCVAMEATAHDHGTAPPPPIARGEGEDITLHGVGYVQRLDLDVLDDIAKDRSLTMELLALPGGFAHAGNPVLRVSAPVDDETRAALRSAFALGPAKTEDQNLIFLAEQQVEMLARALSPGMNDPHTAINCMNWMAAGLAAGAVKGDHFGIQSRERLRVEVLDWDILLQETFGAAWVYAKDDALARKAWDDALDRLEHGPSNALQTAVADLRARCLG